LTCQAEITGNGEEDKGIFVGEAQVFDEKIGGFFTGDFHCELVIFVSNAVGDPGSCGFGNELVGRDAFNEANVNPEKREFPTPIDVVGTDPT